MGVVGGFYHGYGLDFGVRGGGFVEGLFGGFWQPDGSRLRPHPIAIPILTIGLPPLPHHHHPLLPPPTPIHTRLFNPPAHIQIPLRVTIRPNLVFIIRRAMLTALLIVNLLAAESRDSLEIPDWLASSEEVGGGGEFCWVLELGGFCHGLLLADFVHLAEEAAAFAGGDCHGVGVALHVGELEVAHGVVGLAFVALHKQLDVVG